MRVTRQGCRNQRNVAKDRQTFVSLCMMRHVGRGGTLQGDTKLECRQALHSPLIYRCYGVILVNLLVGPFSQPSSYCPVPSLETQHLLSTLKRHMPPSWLSTSFLLLSRQRFD